MGYRFGRSREEVRMNGVAKRTTQRNWRFSSSSEFATALQTGKGSGRPL